MNDSDLKDRLARQPQITLGVISLAVFVGSAVAQTPVPHPLLGYGWGVDHVGVGVRDLSNAQRDYEQLGFKIDEDGIDLENKTYLELLSVKEPQSNAASQDVDARIADFVKKHEGAIFLGLNVSSAKVAASYLKAQNFDVEGNFDVKPPPPFYFVRTAFKPAPNKLGFSVPIFLVEYHSTSNWYDKARKEGWMEHPNTAIGIHAVWFAVHDLKPQLRTLRDAGFENDESCDVQLLGARGCELKAGSGRMILLESTNKSSVLQKYLSDHDDGIIAISVEVSDLSKARRLVESLTGGKLGVYKGTYGQSFLLSPDVTHGVWLEMFQNERSRSAYPLRYHR